MPAATWTGMWHHDEAERSVIAPHERVQSSFSIKGALRTGEHALLTSSGPDQIINSSHAIIHSGAGKCTVHLTILLVIYP
jgi:hypothetical protein